MLKEKTFTDGVENSHENEEEKGFDPLKGKE